MGGDERDLGHEGEEAKAEAQGGQAKQAELASGPKEGEGHGGARQTEAPEHPLVETVNSIRGELQAAAGEIEALVEQLSGHRDVANLGPQIALARTIATRLGSVGGLVA